MAISVTGSKMLLTRSQMVAAFFLTSLCTGFCYPESSGTEFVTAFMENIAYYYWSPPLYRLLISSLKSGTEVNVSAADQTFKTTLSMSAGQTQELILPNGLELDKFNTSYKTVRVTSSSPVTVFSVNQKFTSFDTGMVQPVQNLGTEYRLASPADPTDHLYQFVVINTQVANTVTISQPSQEPLTVNLGPYENAKFQSPKYPVSTQVTAKTPVAVLFGNPCIAKPQCQCGLVFEQLTPVSSWGRTFIVPSLSVSDAKRNQTILLVKSDGTGPESILPSEYLAPPSSNIPTLMDTSLYIQAPMPVSISLLDFGVMALIPVERFSTCYLVHTFSWTQNFLLIVVKTADKEGIRLGEQPLTSGVTWVQVKNSDYSVALVNLWYSDMHRVVWHLTSKMGVYIIEKQSGFMLFGSPALSLKVEPDGHKCRPYPGEVELVQETKSWADAQAHCWNLNSQLANLNSKDYLLYAGQELRGVKQSAVWMGFRKSLLSGEWRWLNREPAEYTNWGSGQPNSSLNTQCGMMSVERLTWSAVSCCDQLPFICFEPGPEIPFP
ncbi:IgGFc-binding protein-like [Anguilla rostrata]|uniref:IgGFc-binding protein-like n=1 Tax=Anguilla rostrata TaxID=7938 RepID=UPI0030D4BF80